MEEVSMAGRPKRARVVVYLPPQLVLQFENLAARHGYSRSELIRIAVERGYPGVKKWCMDAEAGGLAADDHAVAGVDLGDADGSAAAVGGGSASKVAALSRYAGSLIGTPEAATFAAVRKLIAAQAVSLGLSVQQADTYVDVLARDVFHRSAVQPDSAPAGAGGSRNARRTPRSRQSRPERPAESVPADGLGEPSAGADGDAVVVPDLD